MKVAIVDIKANTPKYDKCLTDALVELGDRSIDLTLITSDLNPGYYKCKVIQLCRLFNKPMVNVNKLWKGINSLLNYFVLLRLARKNKYDIIHFEWLVFLQQSSIELLFLRLLLRKSKIVLTVHNIYPHSLDVNHNSKGAIAYKERFRKLDRIIDKFIVHTRTSADELSQEFQIDKAKINVCIHGLFLPEIKDVSVNDRRKDSFRISMFGVQSKYKGTDLLVDAISLMSSQTRRRVSVKIAGVSTDYRGTDWPQKAMCLGIEWVDKLLDETELNKLLQESDLIVFPYRVISQSGALLLALSYGKPIIVSDLPSFKETLSGCPDYIFFQSEDSKDLSQKISAFVNGQLNTESLINSLDLIKNSMSWATAADQTLDVYCNI